MRSGAVVHRESGEGLDLVGFQVAIGGAAAVTEIMSTLNPVKGKIK